MKFFADASGWIAVFNEADKYHARALNWMGVVKGQRHRLVTADYVLDEAITFLQSTVNHATAEDFAVWVLKQRPVQIIHVTESIWQDALALFRKYDDKKFSFTDCVSFVVMRQQNLTDTFGFDHHFEQMGFQLWPH